MNNRSFPQLLSVVLLLLVTAFVVTAQQSLPELVKKVKPAVVSIITYDSDGEPLMTGSGFFIDPHKVVTNLHVIRGASKVVIKMLDGKGRTYPAAGLLAVDTEGDLALMRVEMPQDRARSIELAADLPDEGETIFVIGNPLKLEGSVSDGIVSAVREVPNVGHIIQITAPISHGNSGSPVFNLHGQVLGVVTVKVTNGQNINLAIASPRVRELHGENVRPFTELPARTRTDLSESLYQNGLESLWLGNYESALGYFQNAVTKNPRRADAWTQVGYCKVKQGKNLEAIRAYERALELKPTAAEIHNKLGDAYYYAGRLREAIESYSNAVRLAPDYAEGYYNLAVTYYETGNRTMAATEARILEKLDAKLYAKYLSETP
jgi:tetratricopeptide (TPR) repeat protein